VKRLILLALVLATVICNGGFAEEGKELHTHEYKMTWRTPDYNQVINGAYVEQIAVCVFSFETAENKQPLIFEGTTENPKTDFSYMSIEEINQLPDEEILVSFFYDDGKEGEPEYILSSLKKVLLGLESLFDYEKSRDGTEVKKLRIKTLKKTSKPVEYLSFDISASGFESRILYEQLCYLYIEYFVPYTVVNTAVEGSTFEKIDKMRWEIHLPKSLTYCIGFQTNRLTESKQTKHILGKRC
jgi:hypothetical protein